MAELKFVIDNNALDIIRNTPINANFDEMKAALTEFVEPYENLIVSEDAIPEAKADRAKLNKVEKSIDEYRKMVKRAYTEQFSGFEDKCKELTGIVSKASAKIDMQVKAYEERKKDEKLMNLRIFFNDMNDVPEYLKFEDIENPKWGNVTYSMDQCMDEIKRAVEDTKLNIETIKGLHSEYELSLLQRYKETHKIADAIALNGQLYQAKERAERERKIAEQMRLEAEKKRREKETQVELETVVVEKKYKVCIDVEATKHQIFEIEKILSDMGVSFSLNFKMGAEIE